MLKTAVSDSIDDKTAKQTAEKTVNSIDANGGTDKDLKELIRLYKNNQDKPVDEHVEFA